MNNKLRKVSIVIPIYNVEKYITKCITSVIEQDYENLEIILVNDGSTDKSGEIAKKNANHDSRIKYFEKKNGGLSSARNYGLNRATGEFIAFIDSDDWIEKNYVSKNIEFTRNYNCDMVISNIKYIYENGHIKSRVPQIKKNMVLNCKEAINEQFLGNMYKFHIVNKFCKTSLYKDNNIFFPKDKIYEDMFTSYKLILKSKKIGLISDSLYNYLQDRKGSILNTRFNMNRFDILDALNEIINNDEIKKMALLKEKQTLYISNINALIGYLCFVDNKSERKEYLNIIKHDKNFGITKGYLFNNKLKIREKIKLFSSIYFFNIYIEICRKVKSNGE